MKYPALDVIGVDHEILGAMVDDFAPSAAEQHDDRSTFYFTDAGSRRGARDAVAQAWPAASLTMREVDDEDWARRSQDSLTPISVGRIIVTPPWHVPGAFAVRDSPSPERPAPNPGSAVPRPEPPAASPESAVSGPEPRLPSLESGVGPGPQRPAPSPGAITIVITPSMGFGTGHHATTRLCLAALQAVDLTGRRLLDVGTGSGVLALAGRALGACEAVGIDYDADAIQAATENLDANPGIDRVRLVIGDVRGAALAPADIVTANLTGALLVQSARLLLAAVRPGGVIIVSGLLTHERDDVIAAFGGEARLAWETEEQGWLGLAFNSPGVAAV